MNKEKPPGESSCSICRLPKSNNWTIHGLWPDAEKGDLSFCHHEKLDSSRLDPELKQEISEKWPTFKLKFSSEKFWRYEFNKHGTCAFKNPAIKTQSDYFSKALELLDRYNVGSVLQRANILPGDRQYELGDIEQALRNHFRTDIKIICWKSKVNK